MYRSIREGLLTVYIHSGIGHYALEQELTNFLCKRPGSKYSRLCEPYSAEVAIVSEQMDMVMWQSNFIYHIRPWVGFCSQAA